MRDKKLNAYVSVKKTEKGGKKYENIVCRIVLDNGKEVVLQVKESFYNRKFHSLLVCNLPKED